MRLPALVLGLVLVASSALADEAESLFRQAQQAEKSLDFGAALAAYDRALELRPSASFALRARIRRDDLVAHREGDFAPLRHLEQVRRSSALASDPAALDSLLTDARGFPAGRVQAESLLLIAEAYTHRVHDPQRAIEPASLLASGPFDRVLRARGLTLLIEAHEALGQTSAARAAAAAHPGLAPELEDRWRTDSRRRALGLAARVTVALAGALLLAALVKLRRQLGSLVRPWLGSTTSLAVSAAVVGGGVALVRLFDESLSVRPFVLLGVGVWLADRAAFAWRRAFGSSRPVRVALAVIGVATVGAVAALSLLLSDPAYLQSFGL